LTLRLDSSVVLDWANAVEPERMATADAASANFLSLLILIDTTPLGIRNTPMEEGHVDCHHRRIKNRFIKSRKMGRN